MDKQLKEQTLKLAKDLAKFHGTSVDSQMRRFDGSIFSLRFKEIEKFGIYPDKKRHK